MDHLKFSNRYTYPKLHNYEGLLGKIPVVGPSFYLGLEVETENVSHYMDPDNYNVPGSFKAIPDGSLKVHGMEFVTVPIRFKYVEMELKRLFSAIPYAEFSPRTSIHVHMNARDFTDEEFTKFLLLYLIFERNLYMYSGGRWHNNFCIPLQMNPHMTIATLRRAMSHQFDHVEWCKYHGLNVLPILGDQGSSERIGTIEFRHMVGTNKVEWIMNWCNLILCLKLAAKRMTLKDIQHTLTHGLTYTQSFVQGVFKDWDNLIMFHPNTPYSGVNLLRESTLATKCIAYQAGLISTLSKG